MVQKEILVIPCCYNFIINWFFNCICRKYCSISLHIYIILMRIKSNPPLTILTIVFGLLLLNLFFEEQVIFYLCLFLSGIGVFSLLLSKLIEKIWFNISIILSQIIPNILLTIIFFLILTPLALFSRLFKSKTEFISKNDKPSTFKNQNKIFDKNSFERGW